MELASGIREDDKDWRSKSGRKRVKFFGFRSNRKSRDVCLGSGRLLDFCPFLTLMPWTRDQILGRFLTLEVLDGST